MNNNLNLTDETLYTEIDDIKDIISEDYDDLDFLPSEGIDLDYLKKDLSKTGPISSCYTGTGIEGIRVIACLKQSGTYSYTINIEIIKTSGIDKRIVSCPSFPIAYRKFCYLINQPSMMGIHAYINNDPFQISNI